MLTQFFFTRVQREFNARKLRRWLYFIAECWSRWSKVLGDDAFGSVSDPGKQGSPENVVAAGQRTSGGDWLWHLSKRDHLIPIRRTRCVYVYRDTPRTTGHSYPYLNNSSWIWRASAVQVTSHWLVTPPTVTAGSCPSERVEVRL